MKCTGFELHTCCTSLETDMLPNPKSALFNVDLRGPSPVADCLDGLVAFPATVDRIRATPDDYDFPAAMLSGTQVAFDTLDSSGRDGLLFVATAAQDQLCRHIFNLTVLDRYTRAYCSMVIHSLFEQLSERHVRTFYILDNAIRDDRLAALLELFELAGIATTTPRRDGTEWAILSTRLRTTLNTVGHIAYIEPDAQVNHIEAALALARESACVATFRNLGPDDPQYEIITFKDS